MENTNENRSSQRPAYEAPELEVALVWGDGVRTETVWNSDEADNFIDFDNL